MNDKRHTPPPIGSFDIKSVKEGIAASEVVDDSAIVAGAKVVCTSAMGDRSDSQMLKKPSYLRLQKSVELGHKDIEFTPLFQRCMAGDSVCEPKIEKNRWQSYNKKKVTATGAYSLLKDKSYMFCTKGFGIIYAIDDGQKIDERQERSIRLLSLRWLANKTEMGYLLGVLNCYAYSKDPVNLNTGNFIYEQEDFNIDGTTPLVFKRFYNAMSLHQGCLGVGWIHSYEMNLAIKRDKLILFLTDGRTEQYRKVSEDLYLNRHTGLESIKRIKNNGEINYVYTTLYQNKHIFDAQGKEVFREDAHQNRVVLQYDSRGSLSQVKSGIAALSFSYDEEGRLTAVQDHSKRAVQFEYNGDNLEGVIDPIGNRVTYRYNQDNKIEAVINPRGIQTIYNEYDQYFRTTKQCFPDGGEVYYVYYDEENMVEMTEQNGNCVRHYYDEKYRNVKTEHKNGQEEFTYNEQNQKIRYKDKRGYLTRYEYDQQGNQTKRMDSLRNRFQKTYNQQNQLLTLTVNDQLKLKNQYDAKGKLIETTDGLERSYRFNYNHQGLLVEFIQPDGSTYAFQYNQQGNLAILTDPCGYQTIYEYDLLNRVIAAIDANGNKMTFEYDDCNNLTQVTDAKGKTKTYIYNESNRVTAITDYNGSTTYQEYGVLRKPNKMIDGMGNVTLLEYDLMWNLCQVVDANGGTTKYSYNHQNLLERITNPLGGTIRFDYDANGNRTKITNADGSVTEFRYDALNRVIAIKEANDAICHYQYDAEGRVVTYIDAMGQQTSYEYDQAGQKIKEVNALGEETHFAYNLLSKLIGISKADMLLVHFQYDSRGLLTDEYYLDGKEIHYSYDGKQNLIKKCDQSGYTLQYEYDSTDRITRIKSNFGQENQYEYDAMGNLTSLIDANGNKTQYLYDLCSNLIGVIDAAGNQTAYGYDGTGKLTHVIQGKQKLFSEQSPVFDLEEVLKINQENQQLRITTYQRNLAGQIEQVTDALGNTERYLYDRAGRLTGKRDKDGYLTTYAYNCTGDIEQIGYGDGRTVMMSYSPLRQLIQFEDWLGITRIEHDALGRTRKVVDGKGREVSYQHGKLGERTSLTYPDGRTVAYEYDECFRLKGVNDSLIKVGYDYDKYGYLKEKSFLDGGKTTYSYNLVGQLEHLTHWHRSEKLDDYHYDYDAMGNKVAVRRDRSELRNENGNYRYQYDELNRLSKVSKDGYLVRHYQYDNYGNRIELTEGKRTTRYMYNELNQLIRKVDLRIEQNQSMTAYRDEDYHYDRRGNLTGVYRNGQLVNQYHFGALNRLEKAMNHVTGMGAAYTYNGFGQRKGRLEGNPLEPVIPTAALEMVELNPTKVVDDVLDMTKQYHNLLQRYEDDQMKSFLWDSNVLGMIESDETTQHYFQDELGSTVRVRKSGTREQQVYGYDEFGNDLHHKKEMVQPFGYTSYQYDEVAGTYYAQAREYVAKNGRFIGEDMVAGVGGHPISLNRYVYCFNQPLDLVDLNGMWPGLVTPVDSDWMVGLIKGVVDKIEKAEKITNQIAEDISVFDEFNTDEQKVGNANYVSAYKGQVVILWTPKGRSGSIGPVMLLEPSEEPDVELIKHEWGHFGGQYQQLGILQYFLGVGYPSMVNGHLPVDVYYTRPWEIIADVYGGVEERTHTKEDIELGEQYLEYLKTIESSRDWIIFLRELSNIKNHDYSGLDTFCP